MGPQQQLALLNSHMDLYQSLLPYSPQVKWKKKPTSVFSQCTKNHAKV
jgi:hypothetical protein